MDAAKVPALHSQMVPFVAQEFGLPYAVQKIYATRGAFLFVLVRSCFRLGQFMTSVDQKLTSVTLL